MSSEVAGSVVRGGTAAGGLAEVLVATNCPSASWWAMTTRSACQRSSSSVEMPA